jgi:hypothetical protein
MAVAAVACDDPVRPVRSPGQRICDGGCCDSVTVAQGDVHGYGTRAGGEVERPAQRVDEPPAARARLADTARLFSDDLIGRTAGEQQLYHGALRVDIDIGGEVATALVDPGESSSKAVPNHVGARLGCCDG